MTIVTFAVETSPKRAVSFDIVEVRDGCAFLVDLSADWNEYRSIAEAAEATLHYCRSVHGAERIVARDRRQGWIDISSEDGATVVRPLGDDVPIWIELKSWLGGGSGGFPVGAF